jgi:hypothetical protein
MSISQSTCSNVVVVPSRYFCVSVQDTAGEESRNTIIHVLESL